MRNSRFAVESLLVACTCAVLSPAVVARTGGDTLVVQELYSFTLSPGSTTVPVAQFDEAGGAGQLQGVTIAIEATMGAHVTVENDSGRPAPDLALHLAGFQTIQAPGVPQLVLIFDETEMTDGSVAGSDGVPGRGPDFWDFGVVSDTRTASDGSTSGLAPFIGNGTVDVVIQASGGFSVSGAPASTVWLTDFEGTGSVTVTYAFEPVDPPCAGDFDGSGSVGFADLLTVLSSWGPCVGCPADVDMDGEVSFADLLTVLSAWGACP